jgi:methyl-accepting chemotaxis protein
MKGKLIFLCLMVSITPILLLSAVLQQKAEEESVAQFIRSTSKELIHVDHTIHSFFEGVSQNTAMLAEHPTVKKADQTITSYLTGTGTRDFTPSKNGGIESEIYKVYELYAKTHPNAAYVYMATKYGGYVQWPDGDTITLPYNPAERPYYIEAMKNQGNVIRTSAYYAKEDQTVIVSTVTTIKDDKGEVIGVQGLDVSLKGLTDMIRNIRIGENGYVVIVQEDGTILADPKHEEMNFKPLKEMNVSGWGDASKLTTGQYDVKVNGVDFLANVYTSDKTNWKYIAFIQKDELYATLNALNRLIVALVVLAVLVATVLAFILASRITGPLRFAIQHMQRIGAGDFTQTLPSRLLARTDEIGSLARSLQTMQDEIRGVINKVSDSAGQMASASEELYMSADETNKAARQISSAITEVASDAAHQVEMISTAEGMVLDVSGKMAQIGTAVNQAKEAALHATDTASDGTRAVSRAISHMRMIAEKVHGMVDAVHALGAKSNEIGEIVSLISGIAKQTNLLALNAAIEAARAGENGKGFAVVADEVRKLAEQSAEAANHIQHLIDQIRNETANTMMGMNEGRAAVDEGLQMTDQADHAFRQIHSAIDDVLRQISQIVVSMQEIEQVSQHAVSTIRNITPLSQQTSAHSQHVAAAAEQQSSSMEEVSAASGVLSRMADDLNGLIGKFRT